LRDPKAPPLGKEQSRFERFEKAKTVPRRDAGALCEAVKVCGEKPGRSVRKRRFRKTEKDAVSFMVHAFPEYTFSV